MKFLIFADAGLGGCSAHRRAEAGGGRVLVRGAGAVPGHQVLFSLFVLTLGTGCSLKLAETAASSAGLALCLGTRCSPRVIVLTLDLFLCVPGHQVLSLRVCAYPRHLVLSRCVA